MILQTWSNIPYSIELYLKKLMTLALALENFYWMPSLAKRELVLNVYRFYLPHFVICNPLDCDWHGECGLMRDGMGAVDALDS